jgi:hypothetical protein
LTASNITLSNETIPNTFNYEDYFHPRFPKFLTIIFLGKLASFALIGSVLNQSLRVFFFF